jgi:NADH dehydrogenase FAD-containing subunit
MPKGSETTRNRTWGCNADISQANQNHDYQPGWTVVGSGLAPKTSFRRRLDSLIPSHVGHIVQHAAGFEPGSNQVVLADGSKVGYDYLIVASGLQISEWTHRATPTH